MLRTASGDAQTEAREDRRQARGEEIEDAVVTSPWVDANLIHL